MLREADTRLSRQTTFSEAERLVRRRRWVPLRKSENSASCRVATGKCPRVAASASAFPGDIRPRASDRRTYAGNAVIALGESDRKPRGADLLQVPLDRTLRVRAAYIYVRFVYVWRNRRIVPDGLLRESSVARILRRTFFLFFFFFLTRA